MVQSNTLYAPKTGLYLPGTSGNYAVTPDHASLDITGDICFIWTTRFNNLSTVEIILDRWGNNPNAAYRIAKYSASDIRLTWTESGDPSINTSAVFTNFTLSSDIYYTFGVTLDVDNGNSEHVAKLWRFLEGRWVLIETVIGSGTTSIATGTQSFSVSYAGSSFASYLNVLNTSIYDGIGDNSAPGLGTLVAEADFSYPWANNKYTDATGKVWTINGSAWAWEYQDDPEDKYGFTGVG